MHAAHVHTCDNDLECQVDALVVVYVRARKLCMGVRAAHVTHMGVLHVVYVLYTNRTLKTPIVNHRVLICYTHLIPHLAPCAQI
jgi:hypothetical protein